jgi:hypothetical protein
MNLCPGPVGRRERGRDRRVRRRRSKAPCLHSPSRAARVCRGGPHLQRSPPLSPGTHLEGWLARLDEFDRYATDRGVQTIFPGHGPAGRLSLIPATREYLEAFATALETGAAESAEAAMMMRFPDYRVPQFLTLFSLPAYFPAAA